MLTHTQFGIDEIYFHMRLDFNLLEKLSRRAELTLDGSDPVVLQTVDFDIVLIFYRRVPSPSVIYRFLRMLQNSPERQNYIESNSLINADELFEAIKLKQYALVTHRNVTELMIRSDL